MGKRPWTAIVLNSGWVKLLVLAQPQNDKMEITKDNIMNQNKSIMRRVVETFNTGDISSVDEIFSSSYIDHQNDQNRASNIKVDGPEEFKQIVTGARKSLPNLKITIEDMFADGDKIVGRLQWYSIDSTSKKVERETIDILLIVDGKISEHWGAEEWNTSSN